MAKHISLSLTCAAMIGAASFVGSASSSDAATLASVTTYSASAAGDYRVDFNAFLGGSGNRQLGLEDFENLGAQDTETVEQEISAPLGTSVGTFTTLGGTGNGGTVTNPDGFTNTGTQLALRDETVFGRTSLWDNNAVNDVNDSGDWFLDSNDTFGISWAVEANDGEQFNRIAFAMQDGSDSGSFLKVVANGQVLYNQRLEEGPGRLDNGNIAFVVIDFDSSVTGATIELSNFLSNGAADTNDGVSIDGAYVGVVPLPASMAFLLAGVGALAVARKRKG